jgi:thioredoxin 1
MDEKNSSLVTVGDSDFGKTVLESPRPVVVDFSAEWCGPCKAIQPLMEALASEYAGRVTFAKVDVDSSPTLAARYGVRAVPTVMVVANGEVDRVFVGARPPQEYRASIDRVLH